MKGMQKRNIDIVIILLAGALLCFSLYCWERVLIRGVEVYFTGGSAPSQTSQQDMPDKVKVGEEQEQAQEAVIPADKKLQTERAGALRENLLQKLDNLTERIDNFWYVSICRENEWSGIDSAVTYVVTGEISSSQVLLGKEGWLFYKSEFDNDPIGDYEGTKQFTQDELQTIGQHVLRVKEALDEKGIHFTILLCPNKENVYAGYMPENYIHVEKARTDRLAAYLENEGVFVVNLKEDMIRQGGSYPLYYFYDTHWNQLGGYVGTENLLRSWGIAFPKLDEREIRSTRLWDCVNRECQDDLAKLTRLQFVFDDEWEYVVEGTFVVDWSEIENEGYLCFKNPEAVREDKILLVGDSFRRAMLPSLCEEFREVYVVHRKSYEAGMLDEISPDYVIAEYVERYSGELLEIGGLFF